MISFSRWGDISEIFFILLQVKTACRKINFFRLSSLSSKLVSIYCCCLVLAKGSCQRNPFVDPYETFFSVLYMIRNRPLPTLSELATESENTRNLKVFPFCFLL